MEKPIDVFTYRTFLELIMQYIADIHLHSRFARATSKTLNPENLYRWSLIKGLNVVGTGDFTHPLWYEELRDQLEPAEEGLYQLRSDLRRGIDAEVAASLPRTNAVCALRRNQSHLQKKRQNQKNSSRRFNAKF